MFVVCVEFETHPDQADGFADLVGRNAALSLALEPGCHRFDVCRDRAAPHRFFLYELYDDLPAFEAHKGMAHFREFDAVTGPMVTHKAVSTYALLPPVAP